MLGAIILMLCIVSVIPIVLISYIIVSILNHNKRLKLCINSSVFYINNTTGDNDGV